MSIKITEIFSFEQKTKIELPLYLSGVKAGFPSPAESFVDKKLDLNEYLISHPAATFFLRVEGDSMINAGIHSGDILIVDRSIEPSNGKIVIAYLDNDFTVKRFVKQNNKCMLAPENPDYPLIVINDNMNLEIWGVVTFVIHSL